MKKALAIILAVLILLPLGMLSPITVYADEEVIYVKEGGTGDGSSADKALGSLEAANTAAAAKATDVTIKFVGEVTMNAAEFASNYYNEPTHKNKITWTANDTSSKLIIKTGTAIRYYVIGGELCIKDLIIEIDGTKELTIITQLYPVTVDEGVSIKNEASAIDTISIYGLSRLADDAFYDKATKTHTANTAVTIRSGSFKQVVGVYANFTNKHPEVKLNGKVTITVSGSDTFIDKLYPVCTSYNTVTDAEVILDGGVIGTYLGCSDRAYKGGMDTYGASGVTGSFTLYLTNNFDLDKQSGLTGLATNAFKGLCGTTLNPKHQGALEDEGLGKYILKADDEIIAKVAAESTKINRETFDEIQKSDGSVYDTITAPETTAPEAADTADENTDAPTATNAPDTTEAPKTTNAPETADSEQTEEGKINFSAIIGVSVVIVIAGVAAYITVKKKKAHS